RRRLSPSSRTQGSRTWVRKGVRQQPGPRPGKEKSAGTASAVSRPGADFCAGNWIVAGRQDMKHKNSHLLVGYWSRLRRGRDVPDQTDIDPRAIKRLLSYTFILDCENPARPVYRLAGTALCERFGFELKGTSFLAHWESQSG